MGLFLGGRVLFRAKKSGASDEGTVKRVSIEGAIFKEGFLEPQGGLGSQEGGLPRRCR